jgi:hypothetical protein
MMTGPVAESLREPVPVETGDNSECRSSAFRGLWWRQIEQRTRLRTQRMNIRMLARMLAINRLGFGVGFIALPSRTSKGWVGAAAEEPGARVLTRALGARDLALGIGGLAALNGGDAEKAREWMAAQALADGVDLAATLAARRSLPVRNALFGVTMAGASTAIAVAGVLRSQELGPRA